MWSPSRPPSRRRRRGRADAPVRTIADGQLRRRARRRRRVARRRGRHADRPHRAQRRRQDQPDRRTVGLRRLRGLGRARRCGARRAAPAPAGASRPGPQLPVGRAVRRSRRPGQPARCRGAPHRLGRRCATWSCRAAPSPQLASTGPSTSPGSATCWTAAPASCRRASASSSACAGRSSPTPACCCSTSRLRASTRARAASWASGCEPSSTRAPVVLLIDHDMDLVLDVCDVVHVVDGGRHIASGTPAEVRGDERVVAAYLGVDAQ